MALNPVGSPASGIEPTPECHAHTPVLATVDGTTYVANVNDSAGMYIAQDPAIFGAEELHFVPSDIPCSVSRSDTDFTGLRFRQTARAVQFDDVVEHREKTFAAAWCVELSRAHIKSGQVEGDPARRLE